MSETQIVWIVSSPCDCEDPGCYGQTDIKVFTREQTAQQEAEQRSKRYGGHAGRPDMHITRTAIATKTTGF